MPVVSHSIQLLRSFVGALLQYAGYRSLYVTILLLLSTLLQGFSLLMLIPLLGLAGLGDASGSMDSISSTLKGILDSLDVSFSLVSVLAVFLLLASAEAIFTHYRTIALNNLRLDFVNHLRNSLYQKIGRASWQFHSRNHSSESMHLLDNAVNKIGSGTFFVLQIFVLIFQAGVFLFVASKLSPGMTLIMLVTAILLYLLVMPLNKRVFSHGREATSTHQTLYRNMVDYFSGLKLAKSYNRTEQHIGEFATTGKQLLHNQKAVTAASSSAQMWLRIITITLLCIFVYVALTMMHMRSERLLLLIVLVNRLYGVFSSGQNYWQSLLQMLPSYEIYLQAEQRFVRHGEQQQTLLAALPPPASHIRLEDLSFQYQEQTERPTLSNISLTIPAQKTTAIIGSSGAGKSTLTDILMGLLIADKGRITIDERELTPDLLSAWRRHIAYVPQEVYLFDGSIRSNLQWVSDQTLDDESLWTALDAASAGEFVRRLPDQLDTQVGERGVKLSGGERQRIALARALSCKPDLLILDEATSALDSDNERRIRKALTQLHGSMTIIIIAHRLSTIEHADHVIVMEDGRVRESGSWEEIGAESYT
ncbi:MAG: ABC transporter ATP-binding protein [Pseudomonadota bacterium]